MHVVAYLQAGRGNGLISLADDRTVGQRQHHIGAVRVVDGDGRCRCGGDRAFDLRQIHRLLDDDYEGGGGVVVRLGVDVNLVADVGGRRRGGLVGLPGGGGG